MIFDERVTLRQSNAVHATIMLHLIIPVFVHSFYRHR